MTAQQAHQYIAGLHSRGICPGLDRIRTALAAVGDPQKRLRVVHIAGTNGKGSTAEMIRCIVTAGGYRAGAFTSPVVTTLNETITIDGTPIPEKALAALTARIAETAVPLTEFEFITVLALLWFAEQRVDLAVVECGLGGSEDATNVFPAPLCAVLTPISLDHTRLLGETVEEIARQKAGIIKAPGGVVVSPDQPPEALAVILEIAATQGLTVHMPGRGENLPPLGMAGQHQTDNARTAREVAAVLCERGFLLDEQAIQRGLAAAVLPCRQELLRDRLMLDGAHNPAGIAALTARVREQWPDTPVVLLTGMLADKNVVACADLLSPLAGKVICCTPAHPDRALPAEQLATHYPGAAVIPDIPAALEAACRHAEETGLPLLIAGSFYIAAEVRRLLKA